MIIGYLKKNWTLKFNIRLELLNWLGNELGFLSIRLLWSCKFYINISKFPFHLFHLVVLIIASKLDYQMVSCESCQSNCESLKGDICHFLMGICVLFKFFRKFLTYEMFLLFLKLIIYIFLAQLQFSMEGACLCIKKDGSILMVFR